jgi:hypothetical protein
LYCLPALPGLQEDFKGVVVDSEGFKYKPERKNAKNFVEQKWGWTATEPGEWVGRYSSTRSCRGVAEGWGWAGV